MPGPLLPHRLAGRLALAALVALGAVAGLWYGFPRPAGTPDPLRPDPPPPDPREVFPTPFRNARPGVKYVGDAACADCHEDIVQSFHAHPMGRSAGWVGRVAPVEKYGPAAKTS